MAFGVPLDDPDRLAYRKAMKELVGLYELATAILRAAVDPSTPRDKVPTAQQVSTANQLLIHCRNEIKALEVLSALDEIEAEILHPSKCQTGDEKL